MFRVRVRLRLRPRLCRCQSTDYQQFGDRETLTISMWSIDGGGAGAGGTGGNYGLLTQMERCRGMPRGNAACQRLIFVVFLFLTAFNSPKQAAGSQKVSM